MTLRNSLTQILFVLLCFLAFGIASVTYAQEQVAGTSATTTVVESAGDTYVREALPGKEVYSDFVVGPGRFALEIAPGESKTVEMVVSNRMGEKKRFSFGVEDTQGSDDPTQGLMLLGEEQGPYTLRDYISVPHREFELEHGERARIPVTVALPADAAPGGRYGTLLVSIISSPNETNGEEGTKPGAVVISRIGTLFFVTTPGVATHDSVLRSFETRGQKVLFTNGPIDFSLVVENKGTVHTIPYGEVRVRNMLGQEVGLVTLEPWFVMPQSLRLREIAWDRPMLLGRYTAEAVISRGYDEHVDTSTTSFWVIPLGLFAIIGGVLFTFFFILYFVVTRFEFKRKQR